jgi:hypothetical protein
MTLRALNPSFPRTRARTHENATYAFKRHPSSRTFETGTQTKPSKQTQPIWRAMSNSLPANKGGVVGCGWVSGCLVTAPREPQCASAPLVRQQCAETQNQREEP